MKPIITTMVMVLMLGGCTGGGSAITSPLRGSAPAAFAAPDMGVVADESLRVVEIWPGSAVEAAGVQVGDVLLDLTWIPSDATAYVPIGSDIGIDPTLLGGVPAAQPPVESYIDKDTISFTEVDRIISLVGYGVPLKLRLIRGGDQLLELTVIPRPRLPRPLAAGEIPATVTPLPPTYYYY